MALRRQLLLLTCLAAAAVAQHDAAERRLAVRVVAAISAEQWRAELGRTIDAATPIAEIVDVLARLRPQLDREAYYWASRILWSRRDAAEALAALWRDEPAARRARAPVFVDLPEDWLARLAAAGACEREDLEAVARWIDLDALVRRRVRPGSQVERARGRLLRTMSARQRLESGSRFAAMLRTDAGTEQLARELVRDGGVRPFAFADALASNDPLVRRRAALLLRKELGLAVPSSLRRLLRSDPAWREGLPPPERAPAALRTGPPALMIELERFAERHPDYARSLHAACIDEAASSTDAAHVSRCLWLATSVVPNGRATLLRAVRERSTSLKVRALRTLGYERLQDPREPGIVAEEAAAAAPVLLSLLQSDDDEVVGFAARCSVAVLRSRFDETLAAALRTAARAWRDELERCEADYDPMIGCGLPGPRPAPRPVGTAASLTLAAAAGRDVGLLDPLLALVARRDEAQYAAADPAWSRRRFVLRCLEELAPHLEPAAAGRLFDAVAPAGAAVSGLERSILGRVFARVPDDAVAWYAGLPVEVRHGLCCGDPGLGALDERRARALIGATREDRQRALTDVPALLARVPACMVATLDEELRAGRRVELARPLRSLGADVLATLAEAAAPQSNARALLERLSRDARREAPAHPDRDPHALADPSPERVVEAIEDLRRRPVTTWPLARLSDCAAADDAGVRLAAVRALASLDADVWPHAWLVHEALFDPDPRVRELAARSAPRR